MEVAFLNDSTLAPDSLSRFCSAFSIAAWSYSLNISEF